MWNFIKNLLDTRKLCNVQKAFEKTNINYRHEKRTVKEDFCETELFDFQSSMKYLMRFFWREKVQKSDKWKHSWKIEFLDTKKVESRNPHRDSELSF